MTRPARTVAPEMTIGDLLRLFATDEVNAYPVESNGRLVGIVSKADALKAFAFRQDGILPHYDDVMGTSVEEIMSRHVMTVDAESRLQRIFDGKISLQELARRRRRQPDSGRDRARERHPGARTLQPAPVFSASSPAGRAAGRLLRHRLASRRLIDQQRARDASAPTWCAHQPLP